MISTKRLPHPTLRRLARRLTDLHLPLVEDLWRRDHDKGFTSAKFCQHWCRCMHSEIEAMLITAEPFMTGMLPDLIARGQLTGPVAGYRYVVTTATPRLRGSLYGHLAVWAAIHQQPLTADLIIPQVFIEQGRMPNSLVFSQATPLEVFLTNVPDLPGRSESNETHHHWLEDLLASTLACYPHN